MSEVRLKVGQIFHFERDDIQGVVREIFEDETGAQASAVIEIDKDQWYLVDLSKVTLTRGKVH